MISFKKKTANNYNIEFIVLSAPSLKLWQNLSVWPNHELRDSTQNSVCSFALFCFHQNSSHKTFNFANSSRNSTRMSRLPTSLFWLLQWDKYYEEGNVANYLSSLFENFRIKKWSNVMAGQYSSGICQISTRNIIEAQLPKTNIDEEFQCARHTLIMMNPQLNITFINLIIIFSKTQSVVIILYSWRQHSTVIFIICSTFDRKIQFAKTRLSHYQQQKWLPKVQEKIKLIEKVQTLFIEFIHSSLYILSTKPPFVRPRLVIFLSVSNPFIVDNEE